MLFHTEARFRYVIKKKKKKVTATFYLTVLSLSDNSDIFL